MAWIAIGTMKPIQIAHTVICTQSLRSLSILVRFLTLPGCLSLHQVATFKIARILDLSIVGTATIGPIDIVAPLVLLMHGDQS